MSIEVILPAVQIQKDQKVFRDYPEGSRPATLSQIKDAHASYIGFGKTVEFALGEERGSWPKSICLKSGPLMRGPHVSVP